MKLFRRCGIYKNYPLSKVIVMFNVKARFIGLTFGRYAIGVMIDDTEEPKEYGNNGQFGC